MVLNDPRDVDGTDLPPDTGPGAAHRAMQSQGDQKPLHRDVLCNKELPPLGTGGPGKGTGGKTRQLPFPLMLGNAGLESLFSFFSAALRGLWDLSSSTRDRTRALSSEIAES